MRGLLFPAAFVGIGLWLSACAGNWAELTVVDTSEGKSLDETIRFFGSGTDGEDEGEFRPSYSSGALVADFGTTRTGTHFGDKPRLQLQLRARIIDPETWVGDTNTAGGLGLVRAAGFVNLSDETILGVYVTRWHFTGDGARPVEVAGKSRPFRGVEPPPEAGLRAELEFSFRSNCDQRGAPFMFCGAGPSVDDRTAVKRFTIDAVRGSPGCPAEVLRPFLGDGQGAEVTWNAGASLQVSGAQALPCVVTRTFDELRLCGAEQRGVTADGCTWDVSALGWFSSTGGGRADLWVGAVAREGCARAITYCNTDAQAPAQR